MTKVDYQPWLQAILTIAKHYRIEPSEERIRLQLDWNQNQNLDEVLTLIGRQVGLTIRRVKFNDDVINPWRLPVLVELADGQVGVIDPADVRRDMGLLNQNAHLFYGTIRENLTLGAPLARDEDILKALKVTGALSFVHEKKEGLDHLVLEGGVGFSGGQRQALLLARLLIRQPNILLLDEPTAAIDDVAEKQLIDHLKSWLSHRTLIVATHRRAVLELVDRIIVMNDGKIIMDGPADKVLQQSAAKQKTV